MLFCLFTAEFSLVPVVQTCSHESRSDLISENKLTKSGFPLDWKVSEGKPGKIKSAKVGNFFVVFPKSQSFF